MTERLVEAEWGCWEVGARCSPFHPYDPLDPEFRPHPGVRQGTETEVRGGAWVGRTELPRPQLAPPKPVLYLPAWGSLP